MRKSLFATLALAAGLLLAATSLSPGQNFYGPGMMGGYGLGMMGGYGPGMMGGYGPGMMGGYVHPGNLNLTTEDVKKYFERVIAVQGNSRLNVGEVKQKDDDTIVADIVTKDNSLVQRFNVDRRSGFYRPEEN